MGSCWLREAVTRAHQARGTPIWFINEGHLQDRVALEEVYDVLFAGGVWQPAASTWRGSQACAAVCSDLLETPHPSSVDGPTFSQPQQPMPWPAAHPFSFRTLLSLPPSLRVRVAGGRLCVCCCAAATSSPLAAAPSLTPTPSDCWVAPSSIVGINARQQQTTHSIQAVNSAGSL